MTINDPWTSLVAAAERMHLHRTHTWELTNRERDELLDTLDRCVRALHESLGGELPELRGLTQLSYVGLSLSISELTQARDNGHATPELWGKVELSCSALVRRVHQDREGAAS